MEFPPDKIKEIAKRVAESRKVKNYSQRELAHAVNVKKDVIRRLESAELLTVDTNLIHKIAQELQCNSAYLLLEDHLYRSTNPNMHFLEYPNMQKTAEAFIYGHGNFCSDIEYMATHMHEDYQRKVLDLFHTLIMFHKISVQYPNTEPDIAKQFSPDNITEIIKSNFFKKYTNKEHSEK
jgi:transcriptional regulator with XRE-family HTH domain